jgi:hypothetical protein
MHKLYTALILAGILLAGTIGLFQIAVGQGTPPAPIRPLAAGSETQGENKREVSAPAGAAPNAPNAQSAPSAPFIGFIDSPTSVCYKPDPAQDACYVNWYYMSVGAAPSYMISMTVTINALGPVARYQGFFQTSMYVPYNMAGNGYRVACGPKGAGGDPGWGNAYAWTIRARDSANLSSANYGTVYCPAHVP